MTYESVLLICEAHRNITQPDGSCYAKEIATFDLSAMGFATYFSGMLARHPAPDRPKFHTYYGTNGDTPITKDPYGDHLRELPIDEVVAMICNHIKQDEKAGDEIYRRLMPAFALLAAFQHNRAQWDDLVVLHYGH